MHPFLSSLINYEKGLLKYQMAHFDPNRVGVMLEKAGFWYEGTQIFHIAGTKGKGSTALYLARLLRGKYSMVGLYTSPHLFRVEERIRINGRTISSEELNELVERWASFIQKHECSFFEALTFLGMVYFLQKECDAIVLETGMGGRLDATNFVSRPAACLITRIGWDHTKFLGDTLALIAKEKAGIIKPGVLVFSSFQEPEVKEVLQMTAKERGTQIEFVENSFTLIKALPEKWEYRFADGSRWETAQWGEVFVENFLLACKALEGIGMNVPEDVKRQAFWEPLPFRMWYFPPFLFDVAHNPESFLALFRALSVIEAPKDLYIGILAEKELIKLAPIIQAHRALFEDVVCFDFASPRPSGGRLLADLLGEGVLYSPDIPFIDIPLIREKRKISVFTGSFYWAKELFKKHGLDENEIEKRTIY